MGTGILQYQVTPQAVQRNYLNRSKQKALLYIHIYILFFYIQIIAKTRFSEIFSILDNLLKPLFEKSLAR